MSDTWKVFNEIKDIVDFLERCSQFLLKSSKYEYFARNENSEYSVTLFKTVMCSISIFFLSLHNSKLLMIIESLV